MVPMGGVFLLQGGGLQLVCGHMVFLVGGKLRLLLHVLGPELLGRSRAYVHRAFCPRRGGNVTLAPREAYGLLAVNGALISPGTLTCSQMAMAPPLQHTVAKPATSRPPLRPCFPFVPRATTFHLPPKLALLPLHAYTLWPLPFLQCHLITMLAALVRRTLDHAPSE
jgi:hypothetical protein